MSHCLSVALIRVSKKSVYLLELLAFMLVLGCGHEHERIAFYKPEGGGSAGESAVTLSGAIETRDLASIQRFLQIGIVWTNPIKEGRPPLHEAVRVGAVVVAEAFLSGGCPVTVPDATGALASRYAGEDIRLKKLFDSDLDLEDQVRALAAIEKNDGRQLKELLNRNTQLNFILGDQGETPLTKAVSENREKIVRVLLGHQPRPVEDLSNPIDKDLANARGETPLQISRQKGLKRIEQLLLASGAE